MNYEFRKIFLIWHTNQLLFANILIWSIYLSNISTHMYITQFNKIKKITHKNLSKIKIKNKTRYHQIIIFPNIILITHSIPWHHIKLNMYGLRTVTKWVLCFMGIVWECAFLCYKTPICWNIFSVYYILDGLWRIL